MLADALDKATEEFLNNDRSPSRKVNELDTRGSHFYLSLYWAEQLAKQENDEELKSIFSKVHKELSSNEEKIAQELINAQGSPVDIGGYYLPKPEVASKAMRPSETFNKILNSIG